MVISVGAPLRLAPRYACRIGPTGEGLTGWRASDHGRARQVVDYHMSELRALELTEVRCSCHHSGRAYS